MRRRSLCIFWPWWLLLGCAGTAHPQRAILVVHSNVPEAAVVIDGRLVARVGHWGPGRTISPGFHRMEVHHPDHYTHYEELTLGPGQRRVVEVHLERLLD